MIEANSLVKNVGFMAFIEECSTYLRRFSSDYKIVYSTHILKIFSS